MQRLLIGVSCALVMAAAPAAVQAQPTKNLKGTITAVSANSMTVKGPDGDVKFMINGQTKVTAPGGSTKTDAARAEGKTGPAVTAVLKTGQSVDVDYHEEAMHAAEIRVISSVPDQGKGAAQKAQTARGVVTATSGTSLSVKGDAEWTFVVDNKTTVNGTGVGTATKKLQAEGKKPTIADLVHEGDTVSVTYHDVDGAKHASVVRITKRKA